MNADEAKSSIEKGISDIWSKDHEYKDGVYHVTEVCGCIRKAWYQRTRNEPSERNIFMFNGIMFHSLLPKITNELADNEMNPSIMGLPYVFYEAKCSLVFDGIELKGSADLVTKDYVYEFKFSKVDANERPNDFPMQYLNQSNAYANLLGKPKFRIVFVSNTDLSVTITECETSKVLFEMIKEKALTLHKCITDKTPPEHEENKYCCYCKYYKECDANGK